MQLIDADNGAHVWADRFDTDRQDLTEAQNEITSRLARTLNVELVRDIGRRIEQEGAVDPDARDLVMRGWAWYNRPLSAANWEEARRAFERALEIDPRSIDARIGLATVLIFNVASGWSNAVQQDQVRTEQLLHEALERDANRSMAHFAMGMLRRIQNRLTESQIELETTIALDRNDAGAFNQLGQTLMFLGQPEAGIPHIEKAIRLNPRELLGGRLWALGSCHLLLGHVDQAIDLLKRARTANHRLWYIYEALAGALGLKGDLDEARAALAEAIKLNPKMNSLARSARSPWSTNPQYVALREKTLGAGLRRAGFPDE
jgi:adenylate cyclase